MHEKVFVETLKARGSALTAFIENYNRQHPTDHVLHDLIYLEESFSLIISKAFDWSLTHEGWRHWRAVAYPYDIEPSTKH